MNFIVSSTTLLRHLQSISGVLNTNSSLPILDNFLFEIKENTLTVLASDLETTMITSLEVQVEEAGKIAIPAKLILDVLKNLPDQPCSFRIGSDFGIEIGYDNGKSKMVGYNGDEYPKLPVLENKSSVKIPSEILSRAINKTLFATGNDELRPVMSGVFCQLVRYTRKDFAADGNASFILPKKPLNLLKSNVRGDEELTIEFNSSNAIFTFNDLTLICRLIDGKYPNYEAVIPKENPNVLTIDRQQFLSSIKRVSIFSNKTTHQIKLKLAGAELMLSAEDLDFSNEANERLVCHYDGDDMEIGFNSRFLLDMLTNLDTPEVRLAMSLPNKAGLLMPNMPENKDEDILMLVMPVMINR